MRALVVGMAPWNDSHGKVRAFVLDVPFDELRGQDSAKLPFVVEASGLEPFTITSITIDALRLFVGQDYFGYHMRVTSGTALQLYSFSVDEALYDEFYNAETRVAEVAVFVRLIEIARRDAVPTSYVL